MLASPGLRLAMPVLVYRLQQRPTDALTPGGGAALSLSECAAQRIRAALGAEGVQLLPKDIALLRELANQRECDSDLRLVVYAIEQYGGVSVRWI
jgi:hypothetical protein